MPAKIFIALFTWLLSSIAIASDNNEVPDIELLEFLGSFETPDGKWLDPMEIESMLDEENALIAGEPNQERGVNDE